jgi:inner membrane protein
MASPIGHALAGLAIAWGADLVPGARAWRGGPPAASWFTRAGNGLTLTCAALAAAPDLDLFFGRFHRTATHSVTSVIVVALVAAWVAGRGRLPAWRVALMCAGAWGTHILIDWLSADQSVPRGLQILWPFDGTWFISGWDVFIGSERHQMFSAATMRRNVEAIAQEVAILAPIVVVLWLVRVKTLARFAPEMARRHHPAQ